MCIAIYSLKGTQVPNNDILRTCFRNNSDGAGFAFNTDDNKVQIVKGFMDFESFITAFHKYDNNFNFKERGVLIHFRIATHGKVVPGCCHPFPISSNEKHLNKQKFTSSYAAIHNGIIFLTAKNNSAISDTMLFIKDYLSKLSSNRGWFYNPKNIELIHDLIDSKMAIINGNGDIISTSGFEKGSDGNYYSNSSYKPTYLSIYGFNLYDSWYDDLYDECSLMQLKQNELLCYDDGMVEEYEQGFHDVCPIYLTKEGDIYADFEDGTQSKRIAMDKLTYMGKGNIVDSQYPLQPVDFRKDVTAY